MASKIRVIEDVKQFRLDAKFQSLVERERFGQIEIAPRTIRASRGIAAEVTKLAVLRAVAAHTSARARIDSGNEGIRIEPLYRAWLCHAGTRVTAPANSRKAMQYE